MNSEGPQSMQKEPIIVSDPKLNIFAVADGFTRIQGNITNESETRARPHTKAIAKYG